MLTILDADKAIEATNKLLEFLFRTLGVWGTAIAVLLALVAMVAWRIYNDWRKDREVNLALAEKDKTISRLAAQERGWRVQYFKASLGWTDEQIEKFLVQNDPIDIPTARKELEKKS